MGSYQQLQPSNRRCLILVLLIFSASAGILILYCLKPQKDARPIFDQPQTSTSTATLRRVKQITGCLDDENTGTTQTSQGEFVVIYNLAIASRKFGCSESITYTTHSDYGFLENVIPVVEKWNGPVSVAVHGPGYDFDGAVDSIAYLRECASPLVKELVTFHVYFGVEHAPQNVNRSFDHFNCTFPPPYKNIKREEMYAIKNNLLYPINVGRNIARTSSQTHFVLPSDIELYPSLHIIPQFLTMIARDDPVVKNNQPAVYVLHIYEVEKKEKVPETKRQLQAMLKKRTAVPFHKWVCSSCHQIPGELAWEKEEEVGGQFVYEVLKRSGKVWEPVYIGTNAEPVFDERFTWQGRSDKRIQAYALCMMDYNFLILGSGFLVHKPGIKRNNGKAQIESNHVQHTKKLIETAAIPELERVYGHKNCIV